MPSPVNPLERGRSFDILLNSLLEAGVDTSTLAFLLGVNPDTLSAYILNTSVEGSLHVLPGPDWYSSQVETISLIPPASYALATDVTGIPFILEDSKRWRVVVFQSADGNGFETPCLVVTGQIPSMGATKIFRFPMGGGGAEVYSEILPAGDYVCRVDGYAGWGSLLLSAVIQSVPIGVY